MFFLLKMRLRAIKNTSSVINANPFSGPYSIVQREKALKNRKLNQDWFFRNTSEIEKKLTIQELDDLKNDLGI